MLMRVRYLQHYQEASALSLVFSFVHIRMVNHATDAIVPSGVTDHELQQRLKSHLGRHLSEWVGLTPEGLLHQLSFLGLSLKLSS